MLNDVQPVVYLYNGSGANEETYRLWYFYFKRG